MALPKTPIIFWQAVFTFTSCDGGHLQDHKQVRHDERYEVGQNGQVGGRKSVILNIRQFVCFRKKLGRWAL